jgi:hypothetical protein
MWSLGKDSRLRNEVRFVYLKEIWGVILLLEYLGRDPAVH